MLNRLIDRPFVLPMIVLGICILLGAIIFSWSFYAARNSDQTITVTGSAKVDIAADDAKWTIQIYRSAYQDGLSFAYTQVANDAAALKSYFKQAGINEASTTITTATADQDWSSGQNGAPVRYNVHEEITIESSDVHKVEQLAQNVQTLINKGYSISPRQPEYYVSTLPQLRVSLLGQAVADAKARAQEIAKSGGSSVGALRSASSGVVQVMAPNSISADDYGSYDTSTIDKEVSVTARATFGVR